MWYSTASVAGQLDIRRQGYLERCSATCGKILTSSPFKSDPCYGEIWTPCFFGPTRVHIPNGISIGSVVFAWPMVITDRQTDRPHYSVAIGCLWLVLQCGLIMYMYYSCCYDTVLWCMFVIKMTICKDTLTIPDPGWSYSWKKAR